MISEGDYSSIYTTYSEMSKSEKKSKEGPDRYSTRYQLKDNSVRVYKQYYYI